ncbi:Sulfoquinovosyl transferase sqd2 [Boothiomyces macroporosus]|uniref:Sulfoquinovosyl transferase sqd2 n=1 Tax=Boothiomyces macroporosus TaxID=261099 RepID=A0AAD5UJJ8_9FUNG|nr:Sulfoquinovosyl transferase sqd2 [Boothiomyces macroporosus]KAJ3256534.1 Sulfoquinovosyl transferase sqd2 [Boothiomyces macroporosus]
MWLRGVKIYVSYHVYLEYYRDLYFGKILFRKLFNLITDILFPLAYYLPLSFFADCVGIPSKTADSYVFDYSHRVHILKSGLDTRIFHPDAKNYQGDVLDLKSMSTEGPVLIYCGRLAVEKSIDFLIESLAELDTATLVIVGDGPIRKDLEQLSERVVGKEYVYTGESPINGRYRVIFTGMIRNEKIVASYYAQSDIFVSASGSETFGFTVAEAMACGTPSCVVRSGAFTTVYKMIDNWMFDVGNTEQFCQIIRDIYKNSSNRQLSRRIGMQFSIESSVNDLLDTYYWIVGGCQEE